jgi:glycosyltransferase involved in cell wall biosynthesis
MLRIAFVMAETSPRPIGGAKTIYRYADGLAARGHRVVLVHPRASLLASVRARLDQDPDIRSPGPSPGDEGAGDAVPDQAHPWYHSRPEVGDLIVPTLDERWLPGTYDAVIATNQKLVARVQDYSPRMGRKLYFLLDYESYLLGDAAERRVARRSLRIDWPIMVRSLAAKTLVASVRDRPCHLLPGAIDTDRFRMTVPVDSHQRAAIGFPARTERTKRTYDAVRAIELVRSRVRPPPPVWSFGYQRIENLPDWVTHHLAPDDRRLRELYNRTKAFLVPSEWEGFGQPGAEAMACGAALVSTRNGGVEMYATDRRSALLCPPRDPPRMAEAVIALLEDDRLRQAIAREGARSIRRRTWPDAVVALERLLLAETSPR